VKITAKQQVIAMLIVFGIIGSLILITVDWNSLEYSEWERSQALEMLGFAIIMSIALPLSVSMIINQFKEGWKRICYILIGTSGVVGILALLNSGGTAHAFVKTVWGAGAGATIAALTIAVPYLLLSWIKSGFSSDADDSPPNGNSK